MCIRDRVNGLGDGLWVWFAADFDQANALLAAPDGQGEKLAAQGRALHQVVALMIAHRRPSFYLFSNGREEPERLSRSPVRLLAENGLISPASVSYTHLDVYKRQPQYIARSDIPRRVLQ